MITHDIRLRQIVDHVEQVVWMQDLQSGEILYVSPAFEDVWGRSCESLYADPAVLTEPVHPDDREEVLAAYSDPDQEPVDLTYRLRHADGSISWVDARTFIINDENGAPCARFGVAQEITDQKAAESVQQKTLKQIREQFSLSHKMSLARNPELVLETLMSVRELRAAQRASLLFFDQPVSESIFRIEEVTSWSSQKNLPPWLNESLLYEDNRFLELLHPKRTKVINGIKSSSRLTQTLRRILLEAQVRSVVIFPLIALGDWIGSLVVYYDHETRFNHNVLQRLKVLIDQATITLFNLKLLESEKESRQEAERANEIKTEFLAMISHELRTPLTSIIGFTTTLLAKDVTWEPDEQYEFIETIQVEADRLQGLIDHLLDLSLLEAGKLPINLKPVTLREIVEDAQPQLNVLTSEHKLTINVSDEHAVYADVKRITQVLVNLVRNASVYAPKGTEIKITSNGRSEHIQFNVIDQGPGIQSSDHRRVFKAFSRGKNDSEGTSKGAGLGLAICKGLVEAHGGQIWIKKKSTPGTTISFTVPRDFGRFHTKSTTEG